MQTEEAAEEREAKGPPHSSPTLAFAPPHPHQCLHIWDLDVRGNHRGLWRLFRKRNHFLVVGVPASPYS